MKRKLLLSLAFAIGASTLTIAQSKTTGVVNLSTNVIASLTLDSSNSMATLTLTGPTDRWFALAFGSFTSGMAVGNDIVYWNNTTLVDAKQNGGGATNDGTNNWTITSNVNNSPSAGLRTIVATRAFNTGDANDYTFVYNNTDIDFAWAVGSSATFNVISHVSKGVALNRTFTTLGTESFSLKDSQLYPNPSNGNFTIIAKTNLTKIDVYTITGAFVKSINVSNSESEVSVSGLQTGVYLLELQNETEKSWKKVIVN